MTDDSKRRELPSNTERVVEGALEERGFFFTPVQGPPVDMVQQANGIPQTPPAAAPASPQQTSPPPTNSGVGNGDGSGTTQT